MKYKNESRKKFEEALSEAWKYIGPANFNLNSQGEYEDKDVQQVWEGWFLRFQATYEPPKPKPRYHIEYLESEHECTCGDCVYTSAYSTWKSMKRRCNNENDSVYSFYGGRGIGYQESWEDFENFLADMGERPEGMTLDRIDVNGNYTKDNCRWAAKEEQGLNKRPHSKSITGIVGVIPRSNGSFFASFKRRNLGTFRLLEDAVLARRYAEYLWKNGEWDQNLDNLSVRSKMKDYIQKVRKEFTDQQSMAMDILEWAAKEHLKSD